jgi:hypothetical protein
VRVGLDEHEPLELGRIVGHVEAGAGPDVDRRSARLRQELTPLIAQAG